MRINDCGRWVQSREERELARKPFIERFYTDHPLFPSEGVGSRARIIACEELLGIGPAHILIALVAHRLRRELEQRELQYRRVERQPKGGAFGYAYKSILRFTKEEDDLSYWKALDSFEEDRYGDDSGWDFWLSVILDVVYCYKRRYINGDGESKLWSSDVPNAEQADIKALQIRLEIEQEFPHKFSSKASPRQTWRLFRNLLGMTNWELVFIVANTFYVAESELPFRYFDQLRRSFGDAAISILTRVGDQTKKARQQSVLSTQIRSNRKYHAAAMVCMGLVMPGESLQAIFTDEKQKRRRNEIMRRCFQVEGEVPHSRDRGVRWLGSKKQIFYPATQTFVDTFRAPPESTPAKLKDYSGGFLRCLKAIDHVINREKNQER